MINNNTTLTVEQLSKLVEYYKENRDKVIHNYIKKIKIYDLSFFEMRFIYLHKQLDIKIVLEQNENEISYFAFIINADLEGNEDDSIRVMKDFANEFLIDKQ